MKNTEIKDFDTILFESNNDFELGQSNVKRSSQYRIYNKGVGKGLVVYIPGFGADLGSYTDVFCKKIAEKYDLATMCVDYFCMACRPEVGAQVYFEMPDHLAVKKLIADSGGVPCEEINRNIEILNNICRLKNRNEILTASLIPQNNEYQNFGILAALDIINAVRDAARNFALDENNIIIIGSSYGGYIANLVTKISPGYIRAVFDNSSWATPPLHYIVGRDMLSSEYDVKLSENILLRLCVKSPWTIVEGMPNSMGKSKLSIRSFDRNQLKMMADQGAKDSTFYCFYHSIDDKIAPTAEKNEMAKNMMDLGLKVQMKVLEETDIDGSFIKNLSHGMGMSMTKYFDLCFDFIEKNQGSFFSKSKNVVRYSFEDSCYCFDLRHYPLKAGIKGV